MAKHPSEYATVPLGAMHVMQVDLGTVITDERSGQSVTVDDENSAVKGRVIFCTEKTFDTLKSKIREAYDA